MNTRSIWQDLFRHRRIHKHTHKLLWLVELPITCVNIITRIPSAKPLGNMHRLSSICQKLELKDNWENRTAEPHVVTPVSARSPGRAIVLFYEQLKMDGDWRLSVLTDVTVTGNGVWTWCRCSISVCVGWQLHHCCCAFLMHLIYILAQCMSRVCAGYQFRSTEGKDVCDLDQKCARGPW